MSRMASIVAVALVAVVGTGACGGGETPDRPSDCTEEEFFDERNRRCTPCPAVEPPDCPEGCGYRVFERDNGCEDAKCAPNCDLCPVGEKYAEEEAVCRPCPDRPNCDELDCDGELRIEGSFRAPCPPTSAYACGACTSPTEGCASSDDGTCVDSSE